MSRNAIDILYKLKLILINKSFLDIENINFKEFYLVKEKLLKELANLDNNDKFLVIDKFINYWLKDYEKKCIEYKESEEDKDNYLKYIEKCDYNYEEFN